MDFFSINDLRPNDLIVNAPARNGKMFEKLQGKNYDFSSYMQNLPTANEGIKKSGNSDMSVSSTTTDSWKTNQNRVNIKDASDTNAKVDPETVEKVEEFKEEVVSAISEMCDVDESEVVKAMEELGLLFVDLLNPLNLSDLVATLTGIDDKSMLVFDSQFNELFTGISEMASNLADLLEVTEEKLPEMMEEIELSDAFAKVLNKSENADVVQMTKMPEKMDATEVKIEADTKNVETDKIDANAENKVTVEIEDLRKDTSDDARDAKQESESETPLFAQTGMETNGTESMMSEETPVSYAHAYADVDPAQILEQVATNLKVSLSEEVTKMEMQLNPQNLGKVLVSLSAKEGAVTAQFTAQNEIVKEALEMQLADLRENLNQQGVKVDAVEVTVSSHAFERNLDQEEQRQEQEGEMMEKNRHQRRNLRLDSLDELSGLMSEEEMLVARIMKDNGNSMDLTA